MSYLVYSVICNDEVKPSTTTSNKSNRLHTKIVITAYRLCVYLRACVGLCVCGCVAFVCVYAKLSLFFYLPLFSKWTVTELTAYSIIYCEIILVNLNLNLIIYIGIILSLTFHYNMKIKSMSIPTHTHNSMYWCWFKISK